MKSKATDQPVPGSGEERGHSPAAARPRCPADAATRSAAAELLALHFRTLAEPMRIRILQLLQDGEQTVSNIAAELEATQPNVSRHVHILRDGGLIALRHEKTAVYCTIRDPEALAVCDLVCRSIGEHLVGQGKLAGKLKVARR
jgi:DNA-binding transcriptional ArsR family regulator